MTYGHNRRLAWVGCDERPCLARVTVDRTEGTSEHDTNAAAAKARSMGWYIERNARRCLCPAHAPIDLLPTAGNNSGRGGGA